jgi:hypothetical protein
VNPVLAVLTLVSMRIHCTMDNTYTVVTTFLVATRLLNKLSTACGVVGRRPERCQGPRVPVGDVCDILGGVVGRRPERRQGARVPVGAVCDILVDSVLVSVLIYTGVIPYHCREPVVVTLYVLQGLYAAMCMNKVMVLFEQGRLGSPPSA